MDLLPTLTTVDGRIIAAETGEVVAPEDAGAMLTEMLETYRRAKVEADALRLQREDQVRALLAHDRTIEALDNQLADADDVIIQIEATLAGMFTDRAGKVSIDTPAALVTWSVGRETWALAHPASWYATTGARRELSAVLRRVCGVGDDSDGMAEVILGWLAPTRKTGEAPAPRITLRTPDGGAR